MSGFLEATVKGLSDYPEAVRIESQKTGERTILFFAECDKRDIAKIIGSGGAHVKSIRTLIYAMASKHKLKTGFILKE